MKKLFVLCIIVTMLSGCAWFQKTTDLVCNPTPEQQQTAALMLAAIDAAQAALAEFVPMAKIVKASAVLNTIKAGGCFLISELAQVFEVVDAADAMAMKARKMAPKKMPYAPLRKYIT